MSSSPPAPVSPHSSSPHSAANTVRSRPWSSTGPCTKKFNEEMFARFLDRQNQHLNAARQRSTFGRNEVDRSKYARAPMIPISGMTCTFQGDIYIFKPSSPTQKTTKKDDLRMQTTEFQTFLDRQEALVQKRQMRCHSAPPLRQPVRYDEARAREFMERREEALQRKEVIKMKGMSALRGITTESLNDKNSKQTKPTGSLQDFIKRHNPKASEERLQQEIDEASKRWKADYKYDAGESPVLKRKKVGPSDVDAFYSRVKSFPCVSTRSSPKHPQPRQQNEYDMRFDGNPYVGGKAEKLVKLLGAKAGVDQSAYAD